MTRKMIIYVDYENTRLGGKDAFSPTEPAKTLCLTELAKAIRCLSRTRRPGRRIEVRAYRGYFRDDKGRKHPGKQCTCDQCSAHAWEERPLVKLWKEERGRQGTKPNQLKEKGIDSSLALDFAETVYESSHDDIFVIVSSDKDVLSVLEHEPVQGIINDAGGPLVQIAGWKPDVPDRKLYELAKKGDGPALAWLTVRNSAKKHAGDKGNALQLNLRDYNNIISD